MVILDMFPIWAVYVGTVVLVLVAAEIGFRIGIWLQRRNPASGEIRVTGTMVGGMLDPRAHSNENIRFRVDK